MRMICWRSRSYRRRTMLTSNSRPAGPTSITMSRLTAIIIQCRMSYAGKCWKPGSTIRSLRFITTANVSLHTCATSPRAKDTRLCPSICPRRTGVMPSGLLRALSGGDKTLRLKSVRFAAVSWKARSTPSTDFAPALASSAWRRNSGVSASLTRASGPWLCGIPLTAPF